jgi:hypothetical protein
MSEAVAAERMRMTLQAQMTRLFVIWQMGDAVEVVNDVKGDAHRAGGLGSCLVRRSIDGP